MSGMDKLSPQVRTALAERLDTALVSGMDVLTVRVRKGVDAAVVIGMDRLTVRARKVLAALLDARGG